MPFLFMHPQLRVATGWLVCGQGKEEILWRAELIYLFLRIYFKMMR